MSSNKQKHIRYSEGQWFAVPLRKDGYALGIIVRGSYKTKGGLGYFFGPKYTGIPEDKDTWQKTPGNAMLITWFGDLGIINGRWPLIASSRPFSRDEWPMPKFGKEAMLVPGKGIIVEYEENEAGEQKPLRITPVDIKEIIGLPEDVISMGGAVEIDLTKLLDDS